MVSPSSGKDGQVMAVVTAEARDGHFLPFKHPHLFAICIITSWVLTDWSISIGPRRTKSVSTLCTYVQSLVTLPPCHSVMVSLRGQSETRFNLPFHPLEAKSGSPIFSALLLKDFEQGGFLLCFISNSWSSDHSEPCKRMKETLSSFYGYNKVWWPNQ